MAFVHGKECDVIADEHDLTGYLNQANVSFELQTVDVTTFGNDDHVFIGGLKGGSISTSGMFDATAIDGSDVVLNTALGNSQIVTVAFPGLGTIGNRAYPMDVDEVEYQVRAPVNDAVRVTANFTVSKLRNGVVLKDLTAETAAGTFTSVDNSASSTDGAVANLHVTAFTGTDATIKITDSTDDLSFTDLITFTTITGIGSEHKTVAGTVNRYVRVELSGTFTSITFTVSFARN